MNSVILIGRLVANPSFKITETEKKLTQFRLAVKNNNKILFINVVCFEKLAETCFKWLQKGSMVAVNGRLEGQERENKETYYNIVAEDVKFLDKIKQAEQTPEASNENMYEL